MVVSLPENKIVDLISKVTRLYNSSLCTLRDIASVTGLIVSVFPAIKPARLYYRNLERIKAQYLRENNDNYDAVISLSTLAKQDLLWFMNKSRMYNGTNIIKPATVITLTTDASLLDWGVVSELGVTNGTWSHKEKSQHINWLELTAIWLGVQCFVRTTHRHVKVFGDNRSAVAYINNMGGPATGLHNVVCRIWEWCLERSCVIEAFHIPGKTNLEADRLSRGHKINLEWKLHPTVFQWIIQSFF
jgi:hypothetical protein